MTKKTFLLGLLVLCATALHAADEFRTGRLSNGLTYYIRHNAKNPGLADFYLAQRVGSIQEEPHQRGLAHFLEHMAFNGSSHFQGTEDSPALIDWCEAHGINFGADLNAYTSVDRTVYNIGRVPVSQPNVLDSTLLIVEDWCHGLLLTSEEIDKERGVIREEWRSRRTGVQRMQENMLKEIFKGSRYADCMPIGHMDVVENFQPEALRSYYRRWYRPDLQTVVVVGDVDVDQTEQAIRRQLSRIPMPADAPERVYYPTPKRKGLQLVTDRDPEQPAMMMNLYFKRDADPSTPHDSEADRREAWLEALVVEMLNIRFDSLKHMPEPPAHSMMASVAPFIVASTTEALTISFSSRLENIERCFQAVLGEVEQARQHGFTERELQQARQFTLKAASRKAKLMSRRDNRYYVEQVLKHVLQGEPLVDDSTAYADMLRWDASLQLSDVNALARQLIDKRDMLLTIMYPQKEGFSEPRDKDIKRYVKQALGSSYAPRTAPALSANLVSQQPTPGSIISREPWAHGATMRRLSNGMVVVSKPTEHTQDQVIMHHWGRGGTLNFADDEQHELQLLRSMMIKQGAGQFTELQLDQLLASNIVKLEPELGESDHGWSGFSATADLERLLQLLYINIVEPRKDERAFESERSRLQSFFTHRVITPEVIYNDSLRTTLYGHVLRQEPMDSVNLRRVNYDRMFAYQQQIFSLTRQDTLTLVGNLPADEVLDQLLCQWVASLPQAQEENLHAPYEAPRILDADKANVFRTKMQTPTAQVTVFYTFDLAPTVKSDVELEMTTRVMEGIFTEVIREEMGGSYGVGVEAQVNADDAPTALLKISFKTDPDRYAEVMPAVYRIIADLAAEAPAPERLDKASSYMLKSFNQGLRQNPYWDFVLYNQLRYNLDYFTGYADTIAQVSPADIQRIAATMLAAKRRIEITMMAEL